MKDLEFLEDKDAIARFVRNQLGMLKSYELAEDFVGCSSEDMEKYQIGMRFIIEMMLHQIPLYPSLDEFFKRKEMDARTFDEL